MTKYIDRYYLNGECYGIKFTDPNQWKGDMSKRTISQTLNISSYFSKWSGGCAFNPNGTKLYISGYDGYDTKVKQFSLSTAYDISTASYDSSITVLAEDLFFKPDGTVLYTVTTNDNSPVIYIHTLSTPRDISSYATTSVSIGPRNMRSFYISNDGTHVLCGSGLYGIISYTLSTAWDLSTATQLSVNTSIKGVGMWVKPDGTEIFIENGEGTSALTYGTLSTPRDISSLGATSTVSLYNTNGGCGLWFKNDGTIALGVGGGNSTQYITKYSLT